MAVGYTGGDPNKVAKAGDTMTGLLLLSGDPVTPLGAATKQYVDSRGQVGDPWVFAVDAQAGADDLARFNNAVAAAQTYALNNQGLAQVRFSNKLYTWAGATTKSASNKGNSQGWLPLAPAASQKVILELKGADITAGALPHWQQTVAQKAGTVIMSTLTGQTVDGTFGPPSVIGGPTPAQGYGYSAGLFNNMLVVVDGLTIVVPANPSIMGFDFSGMAQCYIRSAAVNATTTPGSGTPTLCTNSWAYGIYTPQPLNNDYIGIDDFAAEGMYSGATLSEHARVGNLRLIYNAVGITVVGNMSDSIDISYASVESCVTDLQEAAINGGTGTTVRISILDVEEAGVGNNFNHQYTVDDASSNLRGEIGVHILNKSGVQGAEPTLNGATKVKVRNLGTPPGGSTAIALPANGQASVPFARDTFVALVGGTVTAVSVDGVTGWSPSGFFVPAGKTFTPTYTGTPVVKAVVA